MVENIKECYICGKNLEYYNYVYKNYHTGLNYLKFLWHCPKVELLCCDCFKKESLLKKGILKIEQEFLEVSQ